MHEDGDLLAWPGDARRARQITSVQAKSVSSRKQHLPDQYFGLRIFALDAGHHPASDQGRYDVSHVPIP